MIFFIFARKIKWKVDQKDYRSNQVKLKQKEVNWKDVELEEVWSSQLFEAEVAIVALPMKFRSCDQVFRGHDRVTH